RQVDIGFDVAADARIAIPVPGPAEVGAFFDDGDVLDAALAQLHRRQQSAEAAADYDYVGFALYPLALEIRDGVWIDVKGRESALERLVLRYGIGPKALLAFLCVAAGQRLDIEVRLAAAIVAHQFILFPSHLQGERPAAPFPDLRSARYR